MLHYKKGSLIIWDWRFFVFIGIIIFIVWIFTPTGTYITGESNPNFFYFTDNNISYSFTSYNPCFGERAERVHLAFNIIENKTQGLLSLEYESDEYSGDIIIDCYTENFEEGIAGGGGPLFYEGERKILGGEISLYPFEEEYIQCESYPSEEIHEILHVFGFDHIDNEESIMHEGLDELILYEGEDDQSYVCKDIEIEIIECLKNIYSNGVNGSSCEYLPSLSPYGVYDLIEIQRFYLEE